MEELLNETDELEAAAKALQSRKGETVKPKKPKRSEIDEEKEHVKQLLQQPEQFYCPTVFGRLWGKKVRKWSIYPQPLTVLIRANQQTMNFKGDTENNQYSAVRVSMVNNSVLLAKFLAIVVAGNGLFYKQKAWFLTRYFLRRLTPDAMWEALKLTRKESDYESFYYSIGWTQSQRLTQPVPIEADKEG